MRPADTLWHGSALLARRPSRPIFAVTPSPGRGRRRRGLSAAAVEIVMTALKGKVALVTGGSRGIGAAIARRLARDGAAVALTYARSRANAAAVIDAIAAEGGQALAIRADSADPAAIRAAVAA